MKENDCSLPSNLLGWQEQEANARKSLRQLTEVLKAQKQNSSQLETKPETDTPSTKDTKLRYSGWGSDNYYIADTLDSETIKKLTNIDDGSRTK